MEVRILNQNFNWNYSIDRYKSFIWVERYNECGDFEIKVPIRKGIFENVNLGDYVEIDGTDRKMIVETIETTSDPDSGDMIIISGRSIESILDRRVETRLNTRYANKPLFDVFLEVADKNFINASEKERNIPNFKFKDLPSDSHIRNYKFTGSSSRMGYLDFVETECKRRDIGFQIFIDDSDFLFSLYEGEDRSYSQNKNPYVIFSNEFGNLLSSKFITSKKTYKTAAYCLGHSGYTDAGSSGRATVQIRRYFTSIDGTNNLELTLSGLERREMILEIDEQVVNTSESWSSYDNTIKSIGAMNLGKHKVTNAFEGTGDIGTQFVYKKDYFLGDIVQLEDQYGNSGPSRITEYIYCDDDSNGIQNYPTFSKL